MTRFESLLNAYKNDTLTPAELNELLQLLETNDTVLNDSILNDLQRNAFAGNTTAIQRQRMFDNIITASQTQRRARVMQLWKRAAVAAAVIVMAGAATYLLMHRKPENSTAATTTNVPQDVMPGGNKALLTLADGSTIVLDSAGNGALAQQGNANVIKERDGQLVYKHEESAGGNPLTIDHSPLTNTLATPRGGQYQLVLPDGSKVWLNAASSIRYPVAFTGNSREVELEGEGYFEITKNASKPFHVKTKTQDVEVLGTHFNVNAYADEVAVKTTLIEGAVKVSQPAIGNRQSAKTAELSVVLKPGEQAELARANSRFTIADSRFITHHSPNLEQVMAWKNGQFYFSNADIETIMRQVARWYDVEVEYKVHPADKYTVSLSRNVPVSKLLGFLELSGGVKFKVEGKKVIVM